MVSKAQLESTLSDIVGRRFSKKELETYLQDALNDTSIKLSKTTPFKPCDDSWICEIDWVKNNGIYGFVEIYFLNTNERGIKYITEYYFEEQ